MIIYKIWTQCESTGRELNGRKSRNKNETERKEPREARRQKRKKIEGDNSSEKYIQTIRGVGYKID